MTSDSDEMDKLQVLIEIKSKMRVEVIKKRELKMKKNRERRRI